MPGSPDFSPAWSLPLDSIHSEMMNVMSSDEPQDRPVSAGPQNPDRTPALPVQGREDTDAGWGEQPEPEDDERLYRERPPHWDSA